MVGTSPFARRKAMSALVETGGGALVFPARQPIVRVPPRTPIEPDRRDAGGYVTMDMVRVAKERWEGLLQEKGERHPATIAAKSVYDDVRWQWERQEGTAWTGNGPTKSFRSKYRRKFRMPDRMALDVGGNPLLVGDRVGVLMNTNDREWRPGVVTEIMFHPSTNRPLVRVNFGVGMPVFWDASAVMKKSVQSVGPSPFLVKRLRGVLFKAAGTCEQGERADLTGCTPASGESRHGDDQTPKERGSSGEKVGSERLRAAVRDKAESIPFETGSPDEVARADYDAIEESMDNDELDRMNLILDRMEQDYRESLADDYEPEVSRRSVAVALDYDLSDVAEAMADIAEDAGNDSAAESILSWASRQSAYRRPVGEDAVEAIESHLREELGRVPEDMEDAFASYEAEMRATIDDGVEQEENSQREQYARDVDYEGREDDRRQYLREFYDEHEDRFAGVSNEDTWVSDGNHSEYRFETSNGNKYDIDVYKRHVAGLGDVHNLEFSAVDSENRFGITGAGNPREVLTTVTTAAVAYAMKHGLPPIVFTAAERSRRSMYDRLVKTVSSVLPEYSAVAVTVGDDDGYHPHRAYVVVKREHRSQAIAYLKNKAQVDPEVLVKRFRWKALRPEMLIDLPVINSSKRLPGFFTKAAGTCKQGERSDLTGCTPASGDPSARKQPGSQKSPDVSPSAKKRMDSVIAKIMNAPTTKPPCCLHAPTTEQLKPGKDGPAKSARVGVPADSVPPPPNEIPRLPNLDPEQREVESRYADAYLDDPQLAVDKYLKALRKRKVGEYPNVFATDDVKMLNRDWNPGKARQGEELPDESKRAMSKYNTAVHQTANAIAKRAFLQYLDDELMEGPPEKRTVLVTNGGCAAGKGSSLRRAGEGEGDYKGTLPAADQVGAIWDAAGEQNATENEWILEECKKRGIKATFAYVWADPKDTWEAEDRGVVRRAMRKGRMVDAKLFADSYAMGAKNMKAFADKHAGDAEFIFLDNRVKGKPKLLDSFPEETLSWDSDEIEQMALSSLERNADNLSKPLLKGGLYGTKIWS